jgi:1,2-diacylglycerol 3-alpha-glucosyltransferase
MRIMIVTQTYSSGNGQASFTIHLAEGLAKLGHQVVVVAPSERMQSYSALVNGVQVEKVAALPMSILHPAMYLTRLSSHRAKQLFAKFQPEIIHIQDHYFLCDSILKEALRSNVPMVGTNHFLPENILPFLRNFPRWKVLLPVPCGQ